jgi:hypothetical protein
MQGCDTQTAITRPKWGLTPDRALQWEEDHPDRPTDARTVPARGMRSTLQILTIDPSGNRVIAGIDPRAETSARIVTTVAT